jgi:murein DD-endopeptidase MepM/ murein hydrolase activator NlpD
VQVEPGDEVRCGDQLALVGSSGWSSMPHLHFEVHDPSDRVVDPFAGPYSQPTSWWSDQGSPDGLPGDGCTAP